MHWGLSRASPVKKLTGLTLGWTQFATLTWFCFFPSQEVMALIRAHCRLHQKQLNQESFKWSLNAPELSVVLSVFWWFCRTKPPCGPQAAGSQTNTLHALRLCTCLKKQISPFPLVQSQPKSDQRAPDHFVQREASMSGSSVLLRLLRLLLIYVSATLSV